jgi:two-component system NtrC family sensor kinase
VRLTALTAGCAAVAMAALTARDVATHERHLLEVAATGAAWVGDTIRGSTRHHMMADQPDDIRQVMEAYAAQDAFASVRILDRAGRVAFSTDPGDVGGRLTRDSEVCARCHVPGGPARVPAPPERWRVVHTGTGERALALATAIPNEPSCSTAACHAHPPEQRMLGVVDVAVSLRDIDAAVARQRRTTLALSVVAALALAGGLGVVALRVVDGPVRQLQAAKDQVAHAEKMASLGRLAASIAHEINNPVAGILTFARLLLRTVREDLPAGKAREEALRQVGLVEREAARTSAIVGRLLDFARVRPLAIEPVAMAAVIDEALALLAHELALRNVSVEKDVQPAPPVTGDFGQLRQALVNVLVNACDAMPGGGRLAVALRPAAGGAGAEVSIADTGGGIAPEDLKHVFDPFFSRKEKGTGLGLSVVYAIMERHGGHIDIQSRVGHGTRVLLRLPAAQGGAA